MKNSRLATLFLIVLTACEASPLGLDENTTALSQAAVVMNSGPTGAALSIAGETLIDFNGVGALNEAAPDITAGGVTVSFGGLVMSEPGYTGNGFGGAGGLRNDVVEADRGDFNGRFLTGEGQLGSLKAAGYLRSIRFGSPVSHVSMYVADIDAGEGITATAYDGGGTALASFEYPSSTNLDVRTQRIDFGEIEGVREVQLVGNDPVGIDNLRFLGGPPPEPATMDFNNLTVGTVDPVVTASGITVSFTRLMVFEVDQAPAAFGGSAGTNQVVVSDRGNLNGRLLGQTENNTNGFVRGLDFDAPVQNVRMYVADIDIREGITAFAYDAAGNELMRLPFAPDQANDSRLTLVDFGMLGAISRVTLVGNDPSGLDNLSFEAWTPPAEPATVDFNDLAVGTVDPVMTAEGVELSFGGLKVFEAGSSSPWAFAGIAGANQVIAADRGNFNGLFLGQSEGGQTHVRSIDFASAVRDVRMYVADIDASNGLVVSAYDAAGEELAQMVYEAALKLDARLELVDFGSLIGIRRVTLVGGDPTGIDNLSFTAAAPPAVVVSGPEDVIEGIEAAFTAAVTQGSGEITAAVWDFGDESGAQTGAAHTYSAAGSYTVTHTVTDASGYTVVGSLIVEVRAAVSPTASLTADAAEVDEGSLVTFTVESTAGDRPIASRVLTFGDGSEPVTLDDEQTEVRHVFTNGDAALTATLSVTDEGGGSDTAEVLVSVKNVAPTFVEIPDSIIVGSNEAPSLRFVFADPGAEIGWIVNVKWRVGCRRGVECRDVDREIEEPGELVFEKPSPYTEAQLPAGETLWMRVHLTEKCTVGTCGSGRTVTHDILVRRKDETPPVVTSSIEIDGQTIEPVDGWYTGTGATLVWSVVEEESNASLQYDCPSEPLSDVRGGVFTCEATSEGGDGFGTTTLNYDNTPPVISGLASGDRFGDTDWFTGSATVVWNVTDNVYPVQTCDEVTIAHSVENAPVTCSATSPAGTTSTTVNVSVDATEPALDYEIVGTPDANGWFTGEGVGVVWTASEDISGATLEGCDSVRVTSDGADQTFTCTARSAGGETTITTAPLNYDNTPPVVVPMVEGTKFADTDWYRGDVTVTWDVQDISPTSVCSATTLTDETGGTDVSCTGTSVGGDATETVNLKMDESGPTLTYELSGQLGENAWYVSGVMVDWSATESLSGETLVDCIDVTLSADTGDQGVTESCTAESAGGSASMTTSPFKIDQTAPTVTLGSYATTYDIGDTVVIDCTATDAGSGIATDCVDINQGAWTFGGTGFFSVQFDATDLAGHSATSMTATFEVTVSAAGLQNVVTAMVTDGNLATSLINHLSTAAAAPNENAAAGSLGSFYNQVGAGMNSGAISAEDGAFLQGLAAEMGANVNENAGGNGKGKGR